MSSYLSNILTNTTSKYNTLRQNLTSSETDGDTEDDSHVCRVLRAYYTEKGRQFPQWLPPDPRRSASSQSVTSTFTSSLRNPSSPQLGSGGGGQQQGRGNLNDLWDQPAQQAPPPQQPLSLRRQAAERSGSSFRGGQQQDMLQPSHAQPPTQGRLLPSQRAGSYQSVRSQHQQNDPSPPQSSGSASGAGGGTAQERLKARLWGRSGSATNLHQQAQQQPSQNTYGGGSGGGGAGFPSRDRFGGPAGPR